MKIVVMIAAGAVCILLLVLGLSFVNHRVKLNSELKSSSTMGQLVRVNGHMVNVFAEGQGEETLVFLAGSGTSAPTLDFKPLWAGLSSQYRTVVLERVGYGFSDVAKGTPRDIDSILAESRQALERAGETPPYILVPHSMSALEAIHWANKYPHEVKAIIGIDPAIPQTYKHIPIPPVFVLRVLSFLGSVGVTRLSPAFVASPVVDSGILTEEEIALYRSLVHRRTLTANMLDEVRSVVQNANTVQAGGIPVATPMFFFISDGKEMRVNDWRELLVGYTKQLTNGQHMLIDAGHYLHHHQPTLMVETIKVLVEGL